jgi:1-acyl-sn-glycerol-3-phosphate acyltransferase
MKILGVEYAPLNVPLERRLQTMAVLFFLFVFLQWVSLIGIATILYLLTTDYYWISLFYIAWYYIDYDACHYGGRTVKWCREWKLWKHFCNYFPITLVKTADLDPNRNYLMCIHPHGIMSFSALGNFGTEATGFSAQFPGLTPHLLTLEAQFYAPFMRELFMMSGACAASARSLRHILTNQRKCEKKGQACGLIVGGAAESLEAFPGKYKLILKNRKGFVRMALQTGTSLVPVFSFGENDLFFSMPNPKNSMLRRFQEKFKKWSNFGLPMFWGRGIFNYSFGILPHRKPIHTVIGKPIEVIKIEEPTNEQVNQLHAKYIEELVHLFDEHKQYYLSDKSTILHIE